MKFFPSNYLGDTRGLSPSAKGIWMDLICYLWQSPTRGKMTAKISDYSRLLGASEKEVLLAMEELSRGGMEGGTCQIFKNSHGDVTVISRRISREEKQREDARLRKQREREKENVTQPSPESHGEKIEDRRKKIEDRKEIKAKSLFSLSQNQKEELAELCSKVSLKFPDKFNPWQWLKRNIDKHPLTHLHVMKQMLSEDRILDPWPYANKIALVEDGNYNERDSQTKSSQYKADFLGMAENLKKIQGEK